jgi:hypothetical protein
MTYVPYKEHVSTVLKFGDFLHLRWVKDTYIMQITLAGQEATFAQTSANELKIDHWFVTFDFAQRQLRLVFNDIKHDPAILTHNMLKAWNSVGDWTATVGNSGTPGEYAQSGFKKVEIFRPPLTHQQTQQIFA